MSSHSMPFIEAIFIYTVASKTLVTTPAFWVVILSSCVVIMLVASYIIPPPPYTNCYRKELQPGFNVIEGPRYPMCPDAVLQYFSLHPGQRGPFPARVPY